MDKLKISRELSQLGANDKGQSPEYEHTKSIDF